MKKEIIMPKIGLDMEEGTIEQWLTDCATNKQNAHSQQKNRLGGNSGTDIAHIAKNSGDNLTKGSKQCSHKESPPISATYQTGGKPCATARGPGHQKAHRQQDTN